MLFKDTQWTYLGRSCHQHSIFPGFTQAVSGNPHKATAMFKKTFFIPRCWLGDKRDCELSYIIAQSPVSLPSRYIRVLPDTGLQFSPTGADAWGIPSSHIFLGNDWPGTKVWLS